MSIAKFCTLLLLAAAAGSVVQATSLDRLLAMLSEVDADRCYAPATNGTNATLQYLNTTYVNIDASSQYVFSFCSLKNVTASTGAACGGKGYFSVLNLVANTSCTDSNTVTLITDVAWNDASRQLRANYSSQDAKTLLRLSVACNASMLSDAPQLLGNVTREVDGLMTIFWASFESRTVCPGFVPTTTTPAPTPAPEPLLTTGAIVGIVVAVVVVGVVLVAICRKRSPAAGDDTRTSNSPYKPMDKV